MLSVLIVCFFAVALFPARPAAIGRDGASDGRQPADAIARSGRDLGARRGASAVAQAEVGIEPVQARHRPAATMPAAAGRRRPPDASFASRRRTDAGSVSPARWRGIDRRPAPQSEDADRGTLASPRSAFTIVEANETIEDVALRVYGTTRRMPTRSGGRIAMPCRAGTRRCRPGMVLAYAETYRTNRSVTARLDAQSRAAEIDDVAVLDDVFLAFEPLQVLGLGLLDRAGLLEVVERGDLGADEALGQVGVDLAGGLDGGGPALEVPAADLGLAGREEGDDADRVVGLADDPVPAQLAARPGRP